MQISLNDRVLGLINSFVESGAEVGLQVAAYIDGELVVDAWAGIANETSGQRVDGDTVFTSWSTTKGFVATCLHILADRGEVDYDTPIAHYWPEFAANGKDAITVRHALTHTAGIPQMPAEVTPEMMTDWTAMCTAIASHTPLWTPGTKVGYHAWTFGWILGEIIRRVTGQPFAQFAQEALCQPLGITDFYVGIPDAVEPRIAPVRLAFDPMTTVPAGSLALQITPPQVTSDVVVNRPDIRRASIPGGGGIMNARAIARHYAMLAGYGQLDGVRILSPARIDIIRTCQTEHIAGLFGEPSRFGLGYGLGGAAEQGADVAMGHGGGEFGHGGNGGSLGFADPARKLSFGLTKNLMTYGADPTQSTAYKVAAAIRAHIDGDAL